MTLFQAATGLSGTPATPSRTSKIASCGQRPRKRSFIFRRWIEAKRCALR